MLRCLRWVMKNYDMSIEVKRANVVASSLMKLQLVKYGKDGSVIDTGVDISVTDNRIEKGLWELEHKTMQSANMEPMNGFDVVLDALRHNKLRLPSHEDLRNEIIMKNHTIRIVYMETDSSGVDLYNGVLLLNGNIVASVERQTRMGHVLDNLENTLFARDRENCRRNLGEFMLKLRGGT